MRIWLTGVANEGRPPCPECRNPLRLGTLTVEGIKTKAYICLCGMAIVIGEQ